MAEDEILDGGCFCGHVRYRLHGRPIFVQCCHCRDCQRQTGGAFVINGMMEAERVEIVGGEPAAVSMPTDSGRPHDIHRCPHCQTAVWSDYGRRGWLRFIRMLTLDRAHEFPPQAHIFTRTKVPWVSLPADQPAFEIYYDPKVLWPEDARIRWQEALTKSGAAR